MAHRPSTELPLQVAIAPDSQVALNDGRGTLAPLRLADATYTRLLASKGHPNEWLEAVGADDIPPDSFRVEVRQDSGTFAGKFFAVWSTVDKQTGIHHYEIREDDPERLGFSLETKKEVFYVDATSPYVLEDQSLRSSISVIAYDHAGNKYEAIALPVNGTSSPFAKNVGGSYWWLSIVLILLIGGMAWWWQMRRKQFSSFEGGIS